MGRGSDMRKLLKDLVSNLLNLKCNEMLVRSFLSSPEPLPSIH